MTAFSGVTLLIDNLDGGVLKNQLPHRNEDEFEEPCLLLITIYLLLIGFSSDRLTFAVKSAKVRSCLFDKQIPNL
ncbi:MAG TPA: hypothetical protein V6D33_10990 [Cyanophyceae cyanobacterium]